MIILLQALQYYFSVESALCFVNEVGGFPSVIYLIQRSTEDHPTCKQCLKEVSQPQTVLLSWLALTVRLY